MLLSRSHWPAGSSAEWPGGLHRRDHVLFCNADEPFLEHRKQAMPRFMIWARPAEERARLLPVYLKKLPLRSRPMTAKTDSEVSKGDDVITRSRDGIRAVYSICALAR